MTLLFIFLLGKLMFTESRMSGEYDMVVSGRAEKLKLYFNNHALNTFSY